MTVAEVKAEVRPPAEPGAEEKAQKAIGYLLARIATTPDLAWRFIATESHARLIGAYAVLTGLTEAEVKERFKATESYCCRECERAKEEAESGTQEIRKSAQPEGVRLLAGASGAVEEGVCR